MCKGKRQTTTSETGGWCDSAARKSYKTDTRLAGALAELFSGRTVVGFGERHGEYRKLILQAGTVKLYDAYDGAPNINYITGGKVFFILCRLFKPLYYSLLRSVGAGPHLTVCCLGRCLPPYQVTS